MASHTRLVVPSGENVIACDDKRGALVAAKPPVEKAPLEVQGAVSRVSPVGCSPKEKTGEGVMSKRVQGTAMPCTTVANLTERSETSCREATEGIRPAAVIEDD